MARRVAALGITIILLVSPAAGQGPAVLRSSEAAAFMGTWAFTMTEPEELKGSQQTVKIWDNGGGVAASFQVGKFPPRGVTGIFKDGDMLVLTVSHSAQPPLLENGSPIWAVVALTLEGDSMTTAQMLERSRTIKRGTGKKLAN
jgi:hypothetical protein